MRCAGFNNVDLRSAEQLGLTVTRVPAYSPHAVAEHTVAMILARWPGGCTRRTPESAKVLPALDGLIGFDLHGRTVGIIGTGKIGTVVAQIMKGFGCQILAYDIAESPGSARAGSVPPCRPRSFSRDPTSSPFIARWCRRRITSSTKRRSPG